VRARHLIGLPLALLIASCGGKGSSVTGPGSVPTPPSGSGGGPQTNGNNTVTLVVFYDENSNGVIDGGEQGRVPDVEVQVGVQSGRSEKGTGRLVLTGVPSGVLSLGVQPDSLPPFYEGPGPATLRVPEDTGRDVAVPLRLHIGQNRPAYYMAFGDSITNGDGSGDGAGYRNRLLGKLTRHFGDGVVVDQGASGTQTDFGASRISGSLGSVRPAYTLILYGTNDWNTASCRAQFPCHVVDNLRLMVRRCKNANSLPVLGTIIPADPSRNIPERNHWVANMNDLIRPMAEQEGALLADLEEKFLAAGNLPDLFSDHVHPNDRGYEIMAAAWFEAIAHGSVTAAPSSRMGFFYRP
jgi:lysophospholipase L1-like esterase